MNFEQWCKLDEMLYVCQADEEYKQYAGPEHDQELIVKLAEMKRLNSRTFIKLFSNQDEALFLGAVGRHCLFFNKNPRTRNPSLEKYRYCFKARAQWGCRKLE